MTEIVLGSASDRKMAMAHKAARELLGEVLVKGYPASSGVPETPYDKETFDGARNRARDARTHHPDADLCIGLESGLIERYGHIFEEAWAAVLARDGKEYFGYSSGLKVPDFILRRMDEQKKPHSEIMTIIEEEFGKLPNDTWGTYSGGIIAREVSLEEALRNALIQVAAPETSFFKK
jgi:inosine/xanthosine triphosphatase